MSPHHTPSDALVRVEDLHIGFGRGRHTQQVVHGISFELRAGQCLALVGQSGSGKSVTARSLVGLAGRTAQVTASRLELGGREVLGFGDRQWRSVRGREAGYVLQDALVSLDPLRPVGAEIAEPLRLHRYGGRKARRDRVLELLEQVGVPEPELRARQLPHELSGGQRQRALIAAAIALDPPLLIADEPTTALDVTVQAQILDLLDDARHRGSALLLISHDLAVVARVADHVAVLRDGEIVETGTVADVLGDPRHPYTRGLISAVPSAGRPACSVQVAVAPAAGGGAVIEARGLSKSYPGAGGLRRTVVDDVSFTLEAGQTLGIVGESGSGKTTTARLVLALTEPDAGEVLLAGKPWTAVPEAERRPRRRLITTVHQDPLGSFDPRWSVGHILTDALDPAAHPTGRLRRDRVHELLDQVGLTAEVLERRPLHLSGGQRQRVAIARALAPQPMVVVCDEPVSALDVSIQARILDLLAGLQERLGVSYLFISHDLGVIRQMSDRLLVMKDGRAVESGPAADVLTNPTHSYTRALLEAVPALPAAAHPEPLGRKGLPA